MSDDIPTLRYFVVDSTTGLSYHNFGDEDSAREAVARMGGDFHLGREPVSRDKLEPQPHKEGEYHG